ncbi:MAG TPA: urease accessory UreF family protein [Streptosporangiaceae bacterium]|jgi:urease accessory protein|nr:urease accessory UreF family protein [Streptosporangiaceae bacterium]
MNTLLLLLLDSRAPAGAHHHSGGMEAAVGTGLVAGLPDLEDFCRAKLRTSARVAAAFAAASCHLQSHDAERAPVPAPGRLGARRADADPWRDPEPPTGLDSWRDPGPQAEPDPWAELDAEFDARTPSVAMRAASRQLGGGLLRLLRSLRPDAGLVTPWARGGGKPAPHHPLVFGAGVSVAGGSPELAARAAALSACASPASAAVRLLGLDPFAVQALLARLAPDVDECARRAAKDAGEPPASLPSDSAPALDLLADYHLTAEVRLFAS